VKHIHIKRGRTARVSTLTDWLGRAERTLDGWGRPAWIAAMVAGFVIFWPAGLALLGYMIWSGRMGCGWRRNGRARDERRAGWGGPTGNSAFDAYREATLRRLEEEREAFSAFLDRLRKAKDQAEFDQFMDDRKRGPAPEAPEPA
jgi:hypothetical protein